MRWRAGLSRTTILSIIVTSLYIVATPLGAQDGTESSIDTLFDGALKVHIKARIIDEGANQELWNMDLTRFTISGRSITVQLEGTNIRVHAEFTPYWESENQLVLVAQGQTWISTDGNMDEPEYRTSFTTLPIELGEPILFLPLGSGHVPVDTERFGRLNIELELNVERYQS